MRLFVKTTGGNYVTVVQTNDAENFVREFQKEGVARLMMPANDPETKKLYPHIVPWHTVLSIFIVETGE